MAFCAPAIANPPSSRYYSIAYVSVLSPAERVTESGFLACVDSESLKRASRSLKAAFPDEPAQQFDWEVLDKNTRRFTTTLGGLPSLSINYYSDGTHLISEVAKHIAIQACYSAQSRFKAPLSFHRSFDEVAREKQDNVFSGLSIAFCSGAVCCLLFSFIVRKTRLHFYFFDRIRC